MSARSRPHGGLSDAAERGGGGQAPALREAIEDPGGGAVPFSLGEAGNGGGRPIASADDPSGGDGGGPIASASEARGGVERTASPQRRTSERVAPGVVVAGASGGLEVRFELRGSETRMVHLACRPPLQALRALRDGATAELAVATLGPGLMGGDHTELAVRVGVRARARVTTTAATRVLPTRGGRGATACVDLSVAASGWLEYLPLPTILQRDAAYRQRTRITLAEGAVGLVGEILVPGRLASGELFAFEELDLALEVRGADGDLLVAERQLLRPRDVDPRTTGGLPEPDVVLASLFVLAPGRSVDLLADAIASRLPTSGLTALPNDAGLLVRAAVPSAQFAERILAEAAIAARGSLLPG